MLLPSKGENALNGRRRGSVLEGMSVHFLTLPKLGGREKVHRAAGLRDEERETTKLAPSARTLSPPLKVKRKKGLHLAAETGERHLQLTLVVVLPEAPPPAEERIEPLAHSTNKVSAREAILVTTGMSRAASTTALALAMPATNVFSDMVLIRLQPLSHEGGILLRIPADPTKATKVMDLLKTRNRQLRPSQRLPSLLLPSRKVRRL